MKDINVSEYCGTLDAEGFSVERRATTVIGLPVETHTGNGAIDWFLKQLGENAHVSQPMVVCMPWHVNAAPLKKDNLLDWGFDVSLLPYANENYSVDSRYSCVPDWVGCSTFISCGQLASASGSA